MMDNEKLNKLLHNKWFLFIVPNLICAYRLLYYYNLNIKNISEVLFSQVIIILLILLGINSIVYLFLNKALKDKHKVFLLMCIISIGYFFQFTLLTFLIGIVFILLLVIDLKVFIHFKLDYIVALVSFVIIFLFGYNFLIGVYNVSYLKIMSKSYDYELEVNVEEDTKTPNIYWVHADGMLGLDAMKKYFKYNKKELEKYFAENDYIVNEEARLVAGHATRRALVAMWNPYYYDNFFNEYLNDMQNTYVDSQAKLSFVVDFKELYLRRINNELFHALDKKDYTTVAIAEFNHHTSLDVDYYYDYYVYNSGNDNVIEKKELRYITGDNSKFKLSVYNEFCRLYGLLNTTFMYPLVADTNFLDYEVVDYQNFNLDDYPHMNASDYWRGKAIMKGIDETLKIDNKRFVFIDYTLNHLPLTYDALGNKINRIYELNTGFYGGNYIHSNKLLIEILKYIHDHDENAVIILQSDHGIHLLEDEDLMKQLAITKEEVQDIRNSVISAFYIPDEYKNGDEEYLNNPLNISRYLVNNYVGKNYEYIVD